MGLCYQEPDQKLGVKMFSSQQSDTWGSIMLKGLPGTQGLRDELTTWHQVACSAVQLGRQVHR